MLRTIQEIIDPNINFHLKMVAIGLSGFAGSIVSYKISEMAFFKFLRTERTKRRSGPALMRRHGAIIECPDMSLKGKRVRDLRSGEHWILEDFVLSEDRNIFIAIMRSEKLQENKVVKKIVGMDICKKYFELISN